MPILTDLNTLFQRSGQGLGQFLPVHLIGHTVNITAAAAGSGNFTTRFHFNTIGSTQPGTLVGIQLPASLTGPLRAKLLYQSTDSAVVAAWLGHLYLIGTVVLSSTGDKFTHNAVTLPVTRTQFGVASEPLSLIPIIYVTTATATTAPVIRFRTVAGGAGYTDQDGNSIVGTLTHTFPAAVTAVASAFILPLEYGDSGVRDISAIEVTTAGSAGAASIFGFEPLIPMGVFGPAYSTILDAVSGYCLADIAPGLPTAGTLTSYLAGVSYGSIASSIDFHLCLDTVLDT